MKYFFIFTLCFFLEIPFAHTQSLFIHSELQSNAAAEHSIDLIQCLFEKTERIIDIVGKNSAKQPLLHLIEEKNNIRATFQHYILHEIGNFPSDAYAEPLCEKIPEILKTFSHPKDMLNPILTSSSIVSDKRKNTFLQDYWPYLTIVGALGIGYFIYEKSRSSLAKTNYQSKGFVLE